jgi:hypothetical protein
LEHAVDAQLSRDGNLTATDRDHLRLLSIFYYILSGLGAICALLPGIYLAMGIGIVAGAFPQPRAQPPPPIQQPNPVQPIQPQDAQPAGPPELVGWIIIVFGVLAMAVGWAYSIVLLLAGRYLRRRRHYVFCIVAACIACLQQPFGTILGVFSIIVLMRPSVKTAFQRNVSTPSHDFDSYNHENGHD